MLDTLDNKPWRLIINVQTKTNVEQAIAENLGPKLSHEERVKLASRPSSDYIDQVWVRQLKPHFEYVVHLETGVIRFGNGDQYTPHTQLYMKEHEWSHNQHGLKNDMLRAHEQWNMNVIDRGLIQFVSNTIHITNINAESLSPTRKEYYDRSPINSCLKSVMIKHPNVTVRTCSRKCDLQVSFPYDWTKCVGALIEQSDLNKRDHLKHVI